MKTNKIFLLIASSLLVIIVVLSVMILKIAGEKKIYIGLNNNVDPCPSVDGDWKWKYNYQNGYKVPDEVGNVSVEGVVLTSSSATAPYYDFYIIRDNQAFPYSGLPIVTSVSFALDEKNTRYPNFDLKIGDVVRICGSVNYDGENTSYVFSKKEIKVINHITPPDPVFLKIRDIVDLSYLAHSFIQTRGRVTKIDNNGIVTLSDGPDKIIMDFTKGSFTKKPELKIGQYLQVTGLIPTGPDPSTEGYMEIYPRFDADIQEISPDAPLPAQF